MNEQLKPSPVRELGSGLLVHLREEYARPESTLQGFGLLVG
jgi:hypothetical protein